MKRYILFDNDGVLVETKPWYFKANVEILGATGLALDEKCRARSKNLHNFDY